MNPLLFNQVYRHINKLPKIIEFLDANDDISKIFNFPSSISSSRIGKYKLLYKGIGKTSNVSVKLPNNNTLFIKREYSNPMGESHYSRYWIPYLFVAESLNLITPNKTQIIEVTSGSAGIALAIAAKELDFRCTIIVPNVLPQSRIQPMIDNGAELIIADGYIDKCIEKLQALVEKNDYFPTNHSEEKSDFIVKIFSRIAKEYFVENRFPDYAVIGLGNGSTTYAIFNEIKKNKCNSRLINYHPDLTKDQVVFGLYGPNVKLRHIAYAEDLTDEKYFTNDITFGEIEDYFSKNSEILSLGQSSKYGISIAFDLAKRVRNKQFFTIGYDRNERY